MTPDLIEQPFESIESAHDFMNILAQTVLDAMPELNLELQRAVHDGDDRRAKAIELAQFKLKTLSCNVYRCRRLLNDLRTLRRLILNERLTVENVIASI